MPTSFTREFVKDLGLLRDVLSGRGFKLLDAVLQCPHLSLVLSVFVSVCLKCTV